MQKLPKILVFVAIIAAVVGIGVLIGWVGVKTSAPNATSGDLPTAEPSRPAARSGDPSASRRDGEPNTNQGRATVDPSSAVAAPTLANWEEKLEEIIGAETDDTNKVAQLFELFPRVPEEAKTEVARHLSNLVSDADYAPLGELLRDPALSEDTLDVLLGDVLNRPNSVKLPQLLEVARTPNHPKAEEAKNILELFLEEDFGADWTKWQEKMVAWLKDNPD